MPADTPTSRATPAEALLLTDRQVAEMLGLGRSTVHRLRAGGKLPPPLRIGGSRNVRWVKAELLAWIDAGCPDGREWQAIRATTGKRLRVCP